VGQSGFDSLEHLLDRPPRRLDRLLTHLQVVLARRADVGVPGKFLNHMQRDRAGKVRAVALAQMVEGAFGNAGSLPDRLEVPREVLPLLAAAREPLPTTKTYF
jgi:hypothetical protein